MDSKLLAHHNSEMARAAAAAMQHHYQEAVEICSELLTSGTYEQLESADNARRCRAEVRLLMATAMHYADAHFDDIVRVLGFAMDSPSHIQKDVCFTLAVVQLSFGHKKEAQQAMQQCLAIIGELKESDTLDSALLTQENEASHFLNELKAAKPQ